MPRRTAFTPTRLVDRWPDEIAPGELVVQERDGQPIILHYLCPCGCEDGNGGVGHMIPAAGAIDNYEGRPTWTLTREQDGTYSASPSILDLATCHSHYYITRNQVVWC